MSHLSTAVAWREKKFQHFVFYKYFSLVLGLLKSRISEKTIELLLNKPDFKLFHYKARVQPVSKLTTIVMWYAHLARTWSETPWTQHLLKQPFAAVEFS
jgi:hypothetical protein